MNKKKIESWSLGKNNSKLIPCGGEILKSIGSEMLLIKFNRDEEGKWSTENPQPIFIQGIGDYDPMTGTYLLSYKDQENKLSTERITPEGFSFNNPEGDGWMHRWITYSLHFKIMEEELYYNRLRTKFSGNIGVLGIEPLLELHRGDQKESLRYHNYIAAVIDTDTENGIKQGILSFRINEICNITKRSKSWSLGIKDDSGFYLPVDKYREENGGWICKDIKLGGDIIGDLKIIDIEDPKN